MVFEDILDRFSNLDQIHYGGNSAQEYLMAIGIFILLLVVLKVFHVVVLARLRRLAKKTDTDFDDVVIDIVSTIQLPLYFFVAVYFSVIALTIPQWLEKGIKLVFILVIAYEVVRALEKIIEYGVRRYEQKIASSGEQAEAAKPMIGFTRVALRIGVWLIAITFVLSNFGVNVTSIIASLGIGGIAIALALQNVLTDIFSSFSIYIDKPFEIGDMIMVGEHKGRVEKIGLKTTRLRSLEGEQIIVSNKELTSARVQNFQRRERRRVKMFLSFEYGSTTKTIEKIPTLVESVISEVEHARFNRCYFSEYRDSAIVFEVVYHIDSDVYTMYMQAKHEINLGLYRAFAKAKIPFAYPTQTIFVRKS